MNNEEINKLVAKLKKRDKQLATAQEEIQNLSKACRRLEDVCDEFKRAREDLDSASQIMDETRSYMKKVMKKNKQEVKITTLYI